jgi:hypothetical protein
MREALAELIALEPVRVRSVVAAIVALVVSFGIDADEGTVLAAVDAILPIISAVVIFLTTRGDVTPVEAPTVPEGTVVSIEGTDRSIVVGNG